MIATIFWLYIRMDNDTTAHIELDTFWPYQVTVLADQVSRYTLSVVKTVADLNQSQWRVLAAVADKPGRTAAEVTAITPMDKTIVSRAVSSLIDLGFIEKTAHRSDKRRLSLGLTPHGRQCYMKVAAMLERTLMVPGRDATTQQALVSMLKSFSEHMNRLAPESK